MYLVIVDFQDVAKGRSEKLYHSEILGRPLFLNISNEEYATQICTCLLRYEFV